MFKKKDKKLKSLKALNTGRECMIWQHAEHTNTK